MKTKKRRHNTISTGTKSVKTNRIHLKSIASRTKKIKKVNKVKNQVKTLLKSQITYDNYFVIIGDNTSDLNYNYLRKQITMNNYNLYECDKMNGYRKRIKILWVDFFFIPYSIRMKYYQSRIFIANQIDNINSIALKDNLFYNMKKYFSNTYKKFIADSFNLTNDYKLEDNKVYISRPTILITDKRNQLVACSGDDIVIVYDSNSLEKAKLNLNKYTSILMSEYIINPLLFMNKKFHVRMYYIITINNNILRTYLMNFGFIYTALLSYKNADYSNKEIHDTHYKSTAKDYMFPKDMQYLGTDNINNIIKQMRNILNYTSQILYNNKVSNYENIANGFYIFGIDFMIKDNYDVMLIECNDTPGYKRKEKDYTLEKELFSFINNVSFKPLLTNTDPIINKNDISTIPVFKKKIQY